MLSASAACIPHPPKHFGQSFGRQHTSATTTFCVSSEQMKQWMKHQMKHSLTSFLVPFPLITQ
jgi:hypothetical protein